MVDIAKVNRTFVEIMQGPNPLTSKDIYALIAKRPLSYGHLQAYADNLAKQESK